MIFSIPLKTGNIVGALSIIGVAKALNLKKTNDERREQCYHVCSKGLGDNLFKNSKILKGLALNYYLKTICPSIEALLGSKQYAFNFVNGNDYRAQKSFLGAKDLNSSICSWKDFSKLQKFILETREQGGVPSFVPKGTKASGVSLGKGIGGGRGGGLGRGDESIFVHVAIAALCLSSLHAHYKGRGGNKGGGGSKVDGNESDGGGIDDDGGPWNEKWEKMKKEAPQILRYKGNNYYLLRIGGNEAHWYVRDKAGHAGSILKKFRDTRCHLVFVGSVNKEFKDMTGKHESIRERIILKSKMKRIR